MSASRVLVPLGAQQESARAKIQARFRALDKNGDGTLDSRELLVLLKRGNPRLSDRDCRSMFNIIDVDRSGRIDFDEFLHWTLSATEDTVETTGPTPPGVKAVFDSFCNQFNSAPAGQEVMDGRTFAKLVKDCRLDEGRGFTRNDIDLVFAKVKARSARTIGLPEFEQALHMIAQRKGCEVGIVHRAIENSDGPHVTATQADNVRFHDDDGTADASAGTAHSNSRARQPSPHRAHTLSAPGGAAAVSHSPSPRRSSTIGNAGRDYRVVDRPDATARAGAEPHHGNLDMPASNSRAVSRQSSPARPESSSPLPSSRSRRTAKGSGRAVSPSPAAEPDADDFPSYLDNFVDAPFQAFCSKDDTMENKDFAKLCREGGIISRRYTATSVDIIFSRVCARGQRRIGLQQFKRALVMISEEKHESLDDVCIPLARLSTGSRLSNATRAADVRLYDDAVA